jgi:hypothetical protein
MSELYKRTKWPMLLKVTGSLSSAHWSDFCKQKEWVKARFKAGYWWFKARMFSSEGKSQSGAAKSKMSEWY